MSRDGERDGRMKASRRQADGAANLRRFAPVSSGGKVFAAHRADLQRGRDGARQMIE